MRHAGALPRAAPVHRGSPRSGIRPGIYAGCHTRGIVGRAIWQPTSRHLAETETTRGMQLPQLAGVPCNAQRGGMIRPRPAAALVVAFLLGRRMSCASAPRVGCLRKTGGGLWAGTSTNIAATPRGLRTQPRRIRSLHILARQYSCPFFSLR